MRHIEIILPVLVSIIVIGVSPNIVDVIYYILCLSATEYRTRFHL